MARGVRAGLAAAAIGAIGALSLGAVGPPAGADYAPYVVLTPTEGPPGTVVSASSDSSGRCGDVEYTDQGPVVHQAGVVLVELGTLADPPDIGSPVTLDEVLASTTVPAGPDGLWTAELVIPADAAPGKLWVTGHCDLPDQTTTTVADVAPRAAPRRLLFDYYPAAFTVTGETTSSSTTTPATTTSVPAPPAPAVEGTSSFTG